MCCFWAIFPIFPPKTTFLSVLRFLTSKIEGLFSRPKMTPKTTRSSGLRRPKGRRLVSVKDCKFASSEFVLAEAGRLPPVIKKWSKNHFLKPGKIADWYPLKRSILAKYPDLTGPGPGPRYHDLDHFAPRPPWHRVLDQSWRKHGPTMTRPQKISLKMSQNGPKLSISQP